MVAPQTAVQVMARNALQVADAASPADQAQALAERAMLLARVGHAQGARAALLEAETCGPFDTLSLPAVHIDLARGAVLYADQRSGEAVRVVRHALDAARLMQRPALQARVLALLALMYLDPMDVEASITCAAEATALRPHADAETRYQTGLAIGTVRGYAGEFSAAAACFARAEADARETGSPFSRAALGFAIARTAITELRQRAMAGTLDRAAIEHGQVALESALQRLRHHANPEALRNERLLVAEMMCRAGDYDGARDELQASLPQVLANGPAAYAAVGSAIEARCLLATGQGAAARSAVTVALDRLASGMADEVIGTVHADVALVLRGLQAHAEADQHLALAAQAWQRVVEGQRRVRVRLAALPH